MKRTHGLPFQPIGGIRIAVALADGVIQKFAAKITIVAMRAGKIYLPHARIENIATALEVAAILCINDDVHGLPA